MRRHWIHHLFVFLSLLLSYFSGYEFNTALIWSRESLYPCLLLDSWRMKLWKPLKFGHIIWMSLKENTRNISEDHWPKARWLWRTQLPKSIILSVPHNCPTKLTYSFKAHNSKAFHFSKHWHWVQAASLSHLSWQSQASGCGENHNVGRKAYKRMKTESV